MTRRGLVLGAGGVLGAAWTIGALAAVEEEYGWDPREAEVLIGTSAGSVLAAFLGCGVGVEQLLNHQRGIVAPGDPEIHFDPDRDSGGALPPRPKLRMGSPRGVLSSALRPWKVTPMGALAAVLPQGRGSLAPLGQLVEAVRPDGGWADHPQTWVVAMDYDSGRRVAFGRDGAPKAELRDAVMASCAIPGWYAPGHDRRPPLRRRRRLLADVDRPRRATRARRGRRAVADDVAALRPPRPPSRRGSSGASAGSRRSASSARSRRSRRPAPR